MGPGGADVALYVCALCRRHGRHRIPPGARVVLPATIERSVWEYFSAKAEQKGAELSELLSDVLKRDIEINEAMK